MSNKILVLIIFILLIVVGVGGFLIFNELSKSQSQSQQSNISKEESNSNNSNNGTSNNMNGNSAKVAKGSIDITDGQARHKTLAKADLPEMRLLEKLSEHIQRNKSQSEIEISVNDLGKSFLDNLISLERQSAKEREMPAELNSLFTSSQAESEANALLLKSLNEYVAYLESIDINTEYIEELTGNTLSKDNSRIFYSVSNDASEAKKLDLDSNFSQFSIFVTSSQAYRVFSFLKDAGIFADDSKENDKKIRDLAIRIIGYHEFTHALQRAYATVNLPEEQKENKSYMSTLVQLGKDLMRADDDKWNIKWGPEYAWLSSNEMVSEERQADAIGFEAIIFNYKMTSEQVSAVEDAIWGRREEARDILNKSISEIYSANSDIEISSLGSAIHGQIFSGGDYSGEDRRFLSNIIFRLDTLPAYAGYFNRMSDSEFEKLIELLR